MRGFLNECSILVHCASAQLKKLKDDYKEKKTTRKKGIE